MGLFVGKRGLAEHVLMNVVSVRWWWPRVWVVTAATGRTPDQFSRVNC